MECRVVYAAGLDVQPLLQQDLPKRRRPTHDVGGDGQRGGGKYKNWKILFLMLCLYVRLHLHQQDVYVRPVARP